MASLFLGLKQKISSSNILKSATLVNGAWASLQVGLGLPSGNKEEKFEADKTEPLGHRKSQEI